MEKYAEGNELFQRIYFQKHEEELRTLVEKGQSPKALFIGCSDSRVIPDLMLQCKPGDLFVIRNVGNFVPPYKPDEDYHSTAAGIEYAVSVLNIEEIILCGHTHCGACKALYDQLDDPSLVHTRKWLDLGDEAKRLAVSTMGESADREQLLRLTEKFSIITQIDNLLTYPSVIKRLKEESLFIHGWYYDIETGNIDYYDPDQNDFFPLQDLAMKCDLALNNDRN